MEKGMNSSLWSHIVEWLAKHISTSDLIDKCRSKKDIYTILTEHCKSVFMILIKQIGQYILPSYSHCPMKFIRDLISGRKKVRLYALISFSE